MRYSTETDHDTSEGSDSNDVEGGKVRVGSSDGGGTLEFGEAERVNALMTDLIGLLQKLECVSKNLVNRETLSILLNTIASLFIQKEIYDDGMDMKLWYKDISYLEKLDSMSFLLQRNNVLLAFLSGCVNFNFSKQTNKTLLYASAVCVEMTYYLRNTNLILPHSFSLNLTQMFVSSSKTTSVIDDKLSPSAGYTSYRNWVETQGAVKNTVPGGDIITFFDNIGRYITKSYRINTSKTKSADIITTTLTLKPKSSLGIQGKPDLKPSAWKKRLNPKTESAFVRERQEKMHHVIIESNKHFREARNCYISKMLELTYEENPADVQIHLNELENCQRECESCFKPYDGLKRKCDDCSGKVVKKVINHTRITSIQNWAVEKHFDIGQVVKRNDSSLKTGEPILVNPNSYNTIKKIISSLKVDLGIGTHRDWVFIGCDGPPYTLASRIIDSDHELDWISLFPGLGHLHMNELKTYFRVVDDIFLHPLGNQVLNFTSSVVYKYFVDAKDTHKAFQALQVLLHGTASKFCRLYILAKGKKNISVNSFLKWASSNENETFNLLFQLIFTFAFAIYAQKIGIRCNDALLTESARLKFMPMFYGFNHPTCQEIEYRDLENRALYPEVLLQFIRDIIHNIWKGPRSSGSRFLFRGKDKKTKNDGTKRTSIMRYMAAHFT